MSLPALRALIDHFPHEDIYLVTKQYLYDVYKDLEGITDIITIPNKPGVKDTFKAGAGLRKYRFGAGLLFTNSFHSALLFKLAGIKELTGYSKDLRGFLLAEKIQFPRVGKKHHTYFYMDLVALYLEKKKAVVIAKKYSDEIIIPPPEKERVRSLLEEFGIDLSNGVIGISSSAAYGTAKQWLPERFGQLMARVRREMPDCEILLFGSDKEREKIARIIDNMESGEVRNKIRNLAGQLRLGDAIAAVSLCDAFVSNDSGLMHVASALRVPTTAIFGPTNPHNTGPVEEQDKKVKILHHPVHCAPCKDRDCPTDHACMKAVTVDEVWDTLKVLLK
ncbi:MAG: lipopolysaccharide heptosyltransferase II [bacterium]|nr:lipopolysaccharide heptosyltransferase II [bacterium]